MADDVLLNAGSGGDTIAADDIGGVKYQRVKTVFGADGAATDASLDAGLPTRQEPNGTTFVRKLDTVGDGTGTKDMGADHSSAEEEFFLTPGSGEVFVVSDLTIYVRDDGTWNGDNFAGLGSALTVGLKIAKRNASADLADLIDDNANAPIKRTADFEIFFDEARLTQYAAAGEYVLRATMKFGPHFPMILNGASNERLRVTANDNLSGVTELFAVARGYVRE